MAWGVFKCHCNIHVAPTDGNGKVLPPHRLDLECGCNPRLDDGVSKSGLPVYIHEQIN